MKLRAFAVLSAAAVFFLAAIPASASSEGHSYLALGDSVPFGFHPDPATWPTANTFIGYPEIVAQRLNVEDVNASCPGQTSDGFSSLSGSDNGCFGFRSAFPLHVSYTGTQLAFATSYLVAHPRTRLVTMMLGANDFFLLQHECTATNTTAGGIAACIGAGLPATLSFIEAHLSGIFAALRATGYNGLIIGVTYYALSYSDPLSLLVSESLANVMIAAASTYGVKIASGFDAFQAASAAFGGDTCAAGLRLPAFEATGCDVHPSATGHEVLAAAVIKAIAATCPAANAVGCLNRNQS
ncbi:MAG TPA: SGNH/GDSL hydrolase family protein [Candidatus Dormibacteraeota bacterium]|nr:SGNH/GDSL hydrolase family protein [Candidatus Dormibacteraeota bacterium]